MNAAVQVREMIQRSVRAWADQDLEAATADLADNVVHALNIDPSIAPFTASAVGKADVRAKFASIMAAFEFEKFEIVALTALPSWGVAQVDLRYRHRATGDTLETQAKLLLRIRDGKIALIEETHDAVRVESYLRGIIRKMGRGPLEAG